MAPITQFASHMPARGLGGQFALGAVLGVAWTPCTGPALGAARGLAAQTGTATQAAFVMAAFALGAALSLLALSLAAPVPCRPCADAWRKRAAGAGRSPGRCSHSLASRC